MTTTVPDMRELAREIVRETGAELGLKAPEMPRAVHDAYSDFSAAIEDGLGVAEQLDLDLADLDSKRDLIPRPGWERLRNDALAQARGRGKLADDRAARAYEALKGAVTDAALPRLDPAREALARQELATAIGSAESTAAASRAIRLAQGGSREACAALLSPFGETLLEARGLGGRLLADTLKNARVLAAASGAERGETAREQLASQALRGLEKLHAARGAVGSVRRRGDLRR